MIKILEYLICLFKKKAMIKISSFSYNSPQAREFHFDFPTSATYLSYLQDKGSEGEIVPLSTYLWP